MSEGLTKHKIADKIADKLVTTQKEALAYFELLLEIMKSTLENGEKLKIAGFGNFEIKQKADRKGRNPQTGETITIEARRILSFKPSMVLRQSINSVK